AHAPLVPRAPRLHALADPHFLLRELLVELAGAHFFDRERFGLALLVLGEIARVARELAASELEDAARDAIEEAAIVGHEEDRARQESERLLQPFDGGDIQVV